jgi:uncharacterized protein (TIGR02266 family)
VDEAAIIRPSTDPHAAAVTALLVADFLEKEAKGAGDAAELARLARGILVLVDRLGGDYLSDGKDVPGDLVQRGYGVRTAVTGALERAVPDDAALRAWLEAIRLGSGVVDLVYDLRTLADLCAAHSNEERAAPATMGAVVTSRAAADALEFALRTGELPDQLRTRNSLARLWTLFAPAYEHAVMTAGDPRFPPLAIVASHCRARRKPLSLVPPAHISGAPASHVEVEIVGTDLVSIEPPPLEPRAPSVPPISSARPLSRPPRASVKPPGSGSWADARRAPRQVVELEVGMRSDSNLYVGFTENLSCAGVFIATYVLRPIGAEVEVSLTFEGGEALRVTGTVRWQRAPTPDAWPGIGVAFERLSAEDEGKIRKFLSMREPLFYDE